MKIDVSGMESPGKYIQELYMTYIYPIKDEYIPQSPASSKSKPSRRIKTRSRAGAKSKKKRKRNSEEKKRKTKKKKEFVPVWMEVHNWNGLKI